MRRYVTLINIALKDVQGIFVSYLTDDTVYLPERLKLMSQRFSQYLKCNIWYSSQLVKQLDINHKETH